MKTLIKISSFVSASFAVWVMIFAVLAYFFPHHFRWIAAFIIPLLGIVMFGMGLTISRNDFKEVFVHPIHVLIGVMGQFAIMPVLAWLLCKGFALPAEIAAGVILVGCCPGGTSSNVMTLLSRGDVALSITITSVTTLLSPIVTPTLVYFLASQWLDINAFALFVSILYVVVVPIILGLIVQAILGVRVKAAVSVLPLVSVIAIVAIVAAVVASSKEQITSAGLIIFLVVVLHNGLGYLFGYVLAVLCGMDSSKRKAIAIEIGMQNSGLSVALANAHFSPVAAIPGAIFSIWHNISGPLVATFFRRWHKYA